MWLQPVDYSDEQSAYLAALGRAMALAQNFEHNCRFVFGTLDVVQAHESGEKLSRDERRSHARKLQKRSLGAALRGRDGDTDFTADELATLNAARAARNYLAHEAAVAAIYVPPKSGKRTLREVVTGDADPASIARERVEMTLEQLRIGVAAFEPAVRALAKADDLVSRWAYAIQEKDAHSASPSWYVATVVEWILEPLRSRRVIR